jgi:uncharacterized membrane protein
MLIWIVILRLVHILSGVYWAGAAFLMASHIGPAASASGEHGQRFMQQLVTKQRLSPAMAVASLLTFFSGLLLYMHLWMDAMTTARGMYLGTGAVIGTLAFLHGAMAQGRLSGRIKKLSETIEAAGGPPSEAQIAEMQNLAARLNTNGNIAAILLGVTVIIMATFETAPF